MQFNRNRLRELQSDGRRLYPLQRAVNGGSRVFAAVSKTHENKYFRQSPAAIKRHSLPICLIAGYNPRARKFPAGSVNHWRQA